MSDYHQPVFYRFNQDSLLLVNEILETKPVVRNLIDIGAGSGVIGIELANKLGMNNVHFLELQAEWKETLEKNISEFLPGKETRVFWQSVASWNPTIRYDLIVSNPPYFLPENGQLSPDPVRAKCRSFLEDDWKVFGEKCYSALAPKGSAWFVTLSENVPHIKKQWKDIPFQVKECEQLSILVISSPG